MRWKKKNKLEWHHWFAWYPIVIDNTYVWLEWIYRKDVNSPLYFEYEYSFKKEGK
jgi:hypothetical protein